MNTAVHQGGNAHPCSAAGRAQSLKMWTECKHRINKILKENALASRPPARPRAGAAPNENGVTSAPRWPWRRARVPVEARAVRVGPLASISSASGHLFKLTWAG
ncbi:hypothetical protein C7S13_8280 [Burkholderia cepacia]|nr:hypothetical protein [Burkholderia cepacia]